MDRATFPEEGAGESPAMVAFLSALGEAVLEARDFDAALSAVLIRVGHQTGWDFGQAWVPAPEGTALRCHGAWYGDEVRFAEFRAVSQQVTFARGEGLPGSAWASLHPEWVRDFAAAAFPRSQEAQRAGFHTGMAIPVSHGGQVEVVLEFLVAGVRDDYRTLVAFVAAVGTLLGAVLRRLRADAALEDSERRLDSIMATAVEAIVVADATGCIVDWNAGAARMFGYEAEEVLGRPVTLLMPERFHAAHQAGVDRLAAGGPPSILGTIVEVTARRSNGDDFPVELSLARWSSELGTFFAGIVRDITEREQFQQELKAARDAAEQANQAKSEFLSRMSHELRTPLNAVLGFAQLLELDELTPAQQESVAHILKGGRHLLNLIDEVLDIARIESGKLALSPEPLPLTQAVSEALDLVRPLAAARGITLSDVPAPCGAFVVADLSRLKQVLLNLLANGIKYNRPGGSVTLTCQVVRNGWGRVSVTDTGIGIATEKLPLLFTPFERLGAEQSEVEGTGVGLALSRRLVEAMGGVLSVDTALGQGSTFWLELPLADEPGTQNEATTANPKEASRIQTPRQLRMLYIEDNLSNLRLMERLFHDAELLSAMQGELGLVLARQHRPDLILLDLHLPDIPGEEVLRRLRADPATAQVPIVAVSADATPGRVRQILTLGARAYVTKPINVRELLDVVREILDETENP